MLLVHKAKWFGLSLVLHLAVAAGFAVMATHDADLTPDTIMVVLDRLDTPDQPLPVPTRVKVYAGVRAAAPKNQPSGVKTAEPADYKPVQPTPQPNVLRTNVPDKRHEESRIKEMPSVPIERVENVPIGSGTVNPVPQPAEKFQPPEMPQQRYLKEHFTYIRDMITQRLVYPPMARRMNWSGKVVVAFVIAENGTVDAVRVVETSGFPILDRSAMETVRNASPFPKPPVRAEITVPINFRLMQ